MARLQAIWYIVLAVTLVRAVYTDLRRHEIDDWPTLTGLVIAGLLLAVGQAPITWKEAGIGFLVGFGVFAILAIWGMGGGDVKLMALVGAYVGWPLILDVCWLSLLFGAVIGVGIGLVKKQWSGVIVPLAPAIALAVSASLWWRLS